MIKDKNGFTSLEVLIVLMVSAVLIVIWGVSRRSQISATYLREADVLLSDIINKENIAKDADINAMYSNVSRSSMTKLVGGIEVIDGRKYLYFREFEVTDANASSFIATVYGVDGTVAEGATVKIKYENGQKIPIL
ncbi:MAG: hypothetical protein LBL00_04310 [Endomicrobium sp.]|nr:hypothetical protein [Endomicrobium sp.]